MAPTDARAWASVGERLGPEVEQTLQSLASRYNIAPSTQVPIIYRDIEGGGPRVALARWGLIPHWWRQSTPPKFNTINARSEDAATKPMWRDAWRRQRCLIPATHWYEWMEDVPVKRPHALSLPDGKGFMFAGLWSQWRGASDAEPVVTCAILTRDASDSVRKVHERMPVILHPDGWTLWIQPGDSEPRWVDDVLHAHVVTEARAWEISRRINAPRNEGPDLLLPFDPFDES